MSISLSQFRAAANASDAARIELNTAGTDVNQKGRSAGGRAVEWIRDDMGLREDENQRTLQAFVDALKAEYGTHIGGIAETALMNDLNNGIKPLSARQVRAAIDDADTLRARMADRNGDMAARYSRAGRGDAEVGFLVAARDARLAAGVTDADFDTLFDPTHPRAGELRQRIHDAITAKGMNGTVKLTEGEAQDIARDQMIPWLNREHNARTLRAVLARPDVRQAVSDEVLLLAEQFGMADMADELEDAGPKLATRLAEHMSHWDLQKKTVTDVEGQIQADLRKVLLVEIIAGEHGAAISRVPGDPAVVKSFATHLTDMIARMPSAQRQRLLEAIVAEVARLRQPRASDDERTAAQALFGAVSRLYSNVQRTATKIRIQEIARDSMLDAAGTAANGGQSPFPALRRAAEHQNDVIALHLRRLGQPLTALSQATMAGLAMQDPGLAAAMNDMDTLQQTYAMFLGRGPQAGALDWRAGRDRLAAMRAAATSLVAEADGNHLQAFITDRMRDLITDMVGRAVMLLGPAPASFAVIGLGSASRGEASPYSDVEFAILLQQPANAATRDYMIKLSHLVEFQVQNLGENGGREVPTGFHWDAGGNTPLGNAAFIGTAAELVAAHLGVNARDEPQSRLGATMFPAAELLYSDLQDDPAFGLVKDLQRQVEAHLRTAPTPSGTSVGRSLGRNILAEAVNVSKVETRVNADYVDVKYIARLPLFLTQGLALENSMIFDDNDHAINSTLMRIGALVEAMVLSSGDGKILGNAIEALAQARIEAHLNAGKAEETVYLDASKAPMGAYVNEGLRDVIRSLVPFVARINNHLRDPSVPF